MIQSQSTFLTTLLLFLYVFYNRASCVIHGSNASAVQGQAHNQKYKINNNFGCNLPVNSLILKKNNQAWALCICFASIIIHPNLITALMFKNKQTNTGLFTIVSNVGLAGWNIPVIPHIWEAEGFQVQSQAWTLEAKLFTNLCVHMQWELKLTLDPRVSVGFLLARQALYHLSYSPSFISFYFLI